MSYAGMAANIVGGELQGWASVLERNAMFDAYRDELGRQGQYQQQALAPFNANVAAQGSGAAQQQLAQGTADREALYGRVNATPMSIQAAPYSGGVEGARDKAFAAMRGQNRAGLGAYGDWALSKTLNDIQNREALNQVINFAKGTAGVFPYRMYQAQHSMDDLAMIGSAISSIGGGAVNYAQYASQPSASSVGPSQPPANTYYNAPTDTYNYNPYMQYSPYANSFLGY